MRVIRRDFANRFDDSSDGTSRRARHEPSLEQKKEKKNTYPAHASFNRVYLIILVRKGLVEKVNRRLIIIPELDPLKGDSFEFTSS